MDLHYEIKGNGKPVILLHSGAMDSRDWEFITPHLSKSFKVITLDVRGAGKSPVPNEPIDYVKDLRKLLDHLKIKKGALVGHSLGGQIATDFTLTYPKRVSQLVLVAPGLSGFKFSSEHAELESRVSKVAPDVEKMTNIILSEPSWSVSFGKAYDLLREMMIHNIQKTFDWKTFETVSSNSAMERLGEIKTKTLFIIGEKDSGDLFKIAQLYKEVPNINFVRIPGANHIITLTHPKEVSDHISLFLRLPEW